MTKIQTVREFLERKSQKTDLSSFSRSELFEDFLSYIGEEKKNTKWRRPFNKVLKYENVYFADEAGPTESMNSSEFVHRFSEGPESASTTFVCKDQSKGSNRPPITLEEALSLCKVDLDEWKVKSWRWNYWGNSEDLNEGNIQVKMDFERKSLSEEKIIEKLFEKYQSVNMPNFTPSQAKVTEQENFAVINLYDAHLDKVPIMATTGETSSLEENINIYLGGLEELLDKVSGYNVDHIYYPLGNDLFHVNDSTQSTKKGTRLEYYESPEDSYEAICDAAITSIKMVSDLAPVTIPFIKSNHDQDRIHTLSFLAYKMFENTPRVTIDKGRQQRKYIKEGKNLIGFAHGDKEKNKIANLPLLMAQEEKKWWGQTENRQWYLGDLHHAFEYKFLKSKDFPGVTVSFLRSIGTSDEFHHDYGYIGIPKTAYADVWSYQDGVIGRIEHKIR